MDDLVQFLALRIDAVDLESFGELYAGTSEQLVPSDMPHHISVVDSSTRAAPFNAADFYSFAEKLLFLGNDFGDRDDGQHVVIRPLAYCSEEDIARYAALREFPIIPCNLCGSQPNLQRQAIKAMLSQWRRRHPGRIENIARAIAHVSPSQLADRELFDFVNLGAATAGPEHSPNWLTPPRPESNGLHAI